jgi:hypothetical protein
VEPVGKTAQFGSNYHQPFQAESFFSRIRRRYDDLVGEFAGPLPAKHQTDICFA